MPSRHWKVRRAGIRQGKGEEAIMEGGESFRQPACHGVRPLFHCPGCGRPPCVQTAPCPPCRSGRSGMALPHLQELCGRGHHPVLLFPENAVCLTWRNILCWDGGMIRRILGIAVPNGIENGLILLVSPPGAKRVRPVRGGSAACDPPDPHTQPVQRLCLPLLRGPRQRAAGGRRRSDPPAGRI